MDPGDLEGFRQGQRRQESGKAPRQHRPPRPCGPEEREIMETMPALAFALHRPLELITATAADVTLERHGRR
jgi:hypothetical protein